MSTQHCYRCRADVETRLTFCPHCGISFKRTRELPELHALRTHLHVSSHSATGTWDWFIFANRYNDANRVAMEIESQDARNAR